MLSPGTQCELLAAAASFTPAASDSVDLACTGADVADAYRSGDWLKAAGAGTEDFACGYLGDVFAGAAAGFASVAATPVVGVGVYEAVGAAANVVCGGLFDGGDRQLGAQFEQRSETTAALAVIRKGQCLTYDTAAQLHPWNAETCPAS